MIGSCEASWYADRGKEREGFGIVWGFEQLLMSLCREKFIYLIGPSLCLVYSLRDRRLHPPLGQIPQWVTSSSYSPARFLLSDPVGSEPFYGISMNWVLHGFDVGSIV